MSGVTSFCPAVTSSSIRRSSVISMAPLPSASYVSKSVYTWCEASKEIRHVVLGVCYRSSSWRARCGAQCGYGSARRERASAMGVAGASFLMPRRNCFLVIRPSPLVSHSRKRSSSLWRC